MKYILFLFLACSTVAHADTCSKIAKNCEGISAKKMYLKMTPVCVMTANCDFYCGEIKLFRKETKLYCKFGKIEGNNYECLSAEECNTDTSVIKSRDDVAKLTEHKVTDGCFPQASSSTKGL